MLVPASFPVMLRVFAGDERTMVPATPVPDCCQVSVNVPVYTPLYLPDHTPVRPPAGGTGVGVAAAALVGAAVGTGAVVAGATVAVGVSVVLEPPQAASSGARAIALNITMVGFISQVLTLAIPFHPDQV